MPPSSPSPTATRFPSRIDTWIAVLLLTAPVQVTLSLGLGAFLAEGALPGGVLVVFGAGLLLGVVLPIWILLGTSYLVEPGRLRIRSGPFRWTVATEALVRAGPTNSLLAAPALSSRRLSLRDRSGREYVVSPRDADAFVDALREAGAEALRL